MASTTTVLPDVTRADSRFVITGELGVQQAEQQRRAADALIDVWDELAWPEGLLSMSVALGTDRLSLHQYAQWRSPEAYERLLASGDGPAVGRLVQQRAPGIELRSRDSYVLYRSTNAGLALVPGCLVIVTAELATPDEQRQRDYVDAIFRAIDGQGSTGALAAHFHLSTDGKRVLNYAEWLNEAAHVEALERNCGNGVGSGPLWDRVREFPGLKSSRAMRFTPYRSRSTPA